MPALLVVDDDPTIRAMFARALQSLGDVETAAHGAEALRMLGAKRYDVVLLDLHMPVMDGFVVLHTLANRAGPNRTTPIYVITADASEQARIRALRRHAVFLLTKPVPIGTLTALVGSTIKKALARGPGPSSEPQEPSASPEEGRGTSPAHGSEPPPKKKG
jgi:CheY-like chemotaxis protein